jgi:hypothetical protein
LATFAGSHARVVDQQIEPTKALTRKVEQCAPVLARGDIALKDFSACPSLQRFGCVAAAPVSGDDLMGST